MIEAKLNIADHLFATGRILNAGKIFNIDSIHEDLGAMKDHILETHAFTGCDTTSVIYFKVLQDSQHLQSQAKTFSSANTPRDSIIAAGETLMTKLYSVEHFHTLDGLRSRLYAHLLKRKAIDTSFELAVLPPTSAACAQHSIASY